jgi:hypothetical protein
MDTRLKDIVSRENRNILFSFLGAQLFNIVFALFVAWLMFGVVKPALWPTTPTDAVVESVETPTLIDPSVVVIPVEPVATESDVEVQEFTRLQATE